MSARTRHLLLWTAGVACVLAFAVVATGGVSFRVFGVPFRSHKPWGLLLVGVTAASTAILRSGSRLVADDLAVAWEHRATASKWIAATAAACVLAVALAWSTRSAGGSDAYGYVSQALLWAHGQMRVEQPLARSAPWPEPDWTLSPLGYRPGTTPGTIVPTYPPGLPLTMAPFVALGGIDAAFLVVPLMGALAVWLAFIVGRRLGDPAIGASGAVLVATSPILLYQVVQPMSDVPVTAWWLAAIALTLAGRPGYAGLAASGALLTRPNLVPVALAFPVFLALEGLVRRRSVRDAIIPALIFCCTMLPGIVFLMWINQTWYGSPLANGYGTASSLFSAEWIRPNFERYSRWLVESHSPVILLAVVAPLAAWFIGRRPPALPRPSAPLEASLFGLAFFLLVLACYLPYYVFQEWWYLRFLLPGVAVVLALLGAVIHAGTRALPLPLRVPLAVVATCAIASWFVLSARDRAVFELKAVETRYADAGRFAAHYLPERAILLAVQESGSLRVYGNRPTLRWDWLGPEWLEPALEHLRRLGLVPFIVLETWEEPQFRERFAAVSGLGRLDWPPSAEVGYPMRVRFYDPAARSTFLSGRPVPPLVPANPTRK